MKRHEKDLNPNLSSHKVELVLESSRPVPCPVYGFHGQDLGCGEEAVWFGSFMKLVWFWLRAVTFSSCCRGGSQPNMKPEIWAGKSWNALKQRSQIWTLSSVTTGLLRSVLVKALRGTDPPALRPPPVTMKYESWGKWPKSASSVGRGTPPSRGSSSNTASLEVHACISFIILLCLCCYCL